MSFSAESDEYPWEKVEFGNPKQTHLSNMRFGYDCEHNDEAGKDDMVTGLLILEGTKVVWKAAAAFTTNNGIHDQQGGRCPSPKPTDHQLQYERDK